MDEIVFELPATPRAVVRDMDGGFRPTEDVIFTISISVQFVRPRCEHASDESKCNARQTTGRIPVGPRHPHS
jgi:hypothetical protein